MSAQDAWIGLGANLGDRQRGLEEALDALRMLPHTQLTARSRLYRSPAWQADGPEYLNAVARLRTSLPAHDLLVALQAIEARFGRERPYAGAPRTLDLDLLLMGEQRVQSANLIVPHPRLHERAFVLRPLADLDPTLVIPGHGTVADCLPNVAGQVCSLWN